MATPLTTIINWFKTGLKPTEAQFKASWESFWHKNDKIPVGSIENFEDYLLDKADNEALENHIINDEIHVSLTEKETWNGKIGNDDLAASKDDDISKIPNLGIVKDVVNDLLPDVDFDESKLPLINDYSPILSTVSHGEGVVGTIIPNSIGAYADILGEETAQDILDKVLNLETDEEQLFKLVSTTTGATGYVSILINYNLHTSSFYLNVSGDSSSSSSSSTGSSNIWFNEDGTEITDTSVFTEGDTFLMYALAEVAVSPITQEEYNLANKAKWEALEASSNIPQITQDVSQLVEKQTLKTLDDSSLVFYGDWAPGREEGGDLIKLYKKGDVVWIEGSIYGGEEEEDAILLPEEFRPVVNISRMVYNEFGSSTIVNIATSGVVTTTNFDTGESLIFSGCQFFTTEHL